ncbi:FAD-binding oxidoreductase [Dietzia psychralcaliphila]|uniref:FAD-binding oxidoreductase n=1 Tax=Dietzia psychralcaliphila TaxID=139021 RepID=UPI000D320605|nr:FAD-binding oxidoreductase [Dietzia psychralcaliphila]PTM90545.1 FAD/FMN-containing dehydrogenase [Dietzia psychralcaliphila]
MSETQTASPTAPTAPDVAGLVEDLSDLLGPELVLTDDRSLDKASQDGSYLSPILRAQWPIGRPEVVVRPTSVEQVPPIVRAAVRRGVPITSRGKGTGNYGQVVPLHGGLVLDLTALRGIDDVDPEAGTVTAEAGVRMMSLEKRLARDGSQLWMYPSTVQSTLGGFLAGGSAGTGTIVHGRNHEGFVEALDVVFAHPEAEIVHLSGEDAQPFVHTYGVAGIIVRATVRIEPLQDWRCVYASFDDHHDAFAAVPRIHRLDPAPRLCSADGAHVAGCLPEDEAIPPDRASLRTIVEASVVDEVSALVTEAGGVVEAVRKGVNESIKVSTLSYNHPTHWLQKAEPDTWFHMECQGDALVERLDEVEAVYPGGTLHLEAGHGRMFGMLNGHYTDPEAAYAGVPVLEKLGVRVHSPHQYRVDHGTEEVRALAARTDPQGLLNPGRWEE